jgi:hypothetical protein
MPGERTAIAPQPGAGGADREPDHFGRTRLQLPARGRKRATAHEGKIHPQDLAHLIDKHAAEDAIFTADGGSPTVWLLRHVKANGKRRTPISLTHGTMANAMPQALGAKRALPDQDWLSQRGPALLDVVTSRMELARRPRRRCLGFGYRESLVFRTARVSRAHEARAVRKTTSTTARRAACPCWA